MAEISKVVFNSWRNYLWKKEDKNSKTLYGIGKLIFFSNFNVCWTFLFVSKCFLIYFSERLSKRDLLNCFLFLVRSIILLEQKISYFLLNLFFKSRDTYDALLVDTYLTFCIRVLKWFSVSFAFEFIFPIILNILFSVEFLFQFKSMFFFTLIVIGQSVSNLNCLQFKYNYFRSLDVIIYNFECWFIPLYVWMILHISLLSYIFLWSSSH